MTSNINQHWAEQASTPATPSTGAQKIYPKTDGNWYVLDDAGTETQVFLLPTSVPDVVGAASSTDNAVVRFDGTGGKTLQNSGVTIDDSNNVTIPDTNLIRPVLKDYAEALTTVAATGATETLDLESGNVFDITLDASCTLTFSNPPASGRAGSFTLIVRQNGTGGWTLTYPASVKWAGGTPPTLSTAASAIDILTFCTVDGGTVWFGFLAGLAFA